MHPFRQCREKAGLTQKQAALELGVKAPSVSDWEKGKTSPTVENLMKLAELYHITVDELLGRATAGDAQATAALSLDEKKVLQLYRRLTDAGKQYIFQTLLMAQNAMGRQDAPEKDAP